MHRRPPFEDLAFPTFAREFHELFSVRTEPSDYEYLFVTSIYSQLFLMQVEKEERARWNKTVRAAHHYLDHGALKSARAVSEAFMRIADQLPQALNGIHAHRVASEDAVGSDARIRALLAYYKALLEGVVTLAAAPIAVGFALVHNANKAKEFFPKPDGRVSLRAIETMEKWAETPSHRLKEGMNVHIRNAYSHERYRLMDGERVELWDEDRHGRRTWGPETWTGDQLEALCQRLYITVLGMVTALVIFGMNYRTLIAARGWVPSDIQRPPLRYAEAKRLIEELADHNSFSLTDFRREEDELGVVLTTWHRGIDQVEEIVVGGDGWGEVYERPVRYEEGLVIEFAIGLLQRIAHSVGNAVRFWAEVHNPNGDPIGRVSVTRAAMDQMSGRSPGGIELDRKLADVDTLGAATMWLRTESPVRKAGAGRAAPRRRIVVP